MGVCIFSSGAGVVINDSDDVTFVVEVVEDVGYRCCCRDGDEIDVDGVLLDEADDFKHNCLTVIWVDTLICGGNNEVDR